MCSCVLRLVLCCSLVLDVVLMYVCRLLCSIWVERFVSQKCVAVYCVVLFSWCFGLAVGKLDFIILLLMFLGVSVKAFFFVMYDCV